MPDGSSKKPAEVQSKKTETTIDVEIRATEFESDLAPEARELLRDRVEIFAAHEEDELTDAMIERKRGSGVFAAFQPYRQVISAATLASTICATGCQRSLESLRNLGREIEEDRIEQKVDSTVEAVEEISRGKLSEEAFKVILERSAEEDPLRLLRSIDDFKGEPYARDFILTAAANSPDYTFTFLSDIDDQPYIADVVEAIAVNDPGYAQHLMLTEIAAENEDSLDQQIFWAHIDESDDRKVVALREIFSADLTGYIDEAEAESFLVDCNLDITEENMIEAKMAKTKRPKLMLSGIVSYLIDREFDLKEAMEVISDEHAYIDALIWTYQHGTEAEQREAETFLTKTMESRVMEMNKLRTQGGRFSSVDGASATELYYNVTFGGESAISSTARGLLDRFYRQMEKEGVGAVEFIDQLDSIKYSEFVATADFNGKFADFLDMAETDEERKALIERFIAEVSGDSLQENMGYVAQVITYSRNSQVKSQIFEALTRGYEQAIVEKELEAKAAYGLLLALYPEGADYLGEQISEYQVELPDKLEAQEMFNEHGENIQVQYFYNDDDGIWSFLHMVGQYRDDKNWEITDHGTFIEITSNNEERKVIIYANKPAASVDGEKEYRDLTRSDIAKAQNQPDWKYQITDIPLEQWPEEGRPNGFTDMHEYMEQNDQEPVVQIHRGHFHWGYYTRQMLSPSTKLYVDGSCGGASIIDEVLIKAVDTQVVYNTGEGKAGINDLLLKLMNDRLIAGEDIVWVELNSQAQRELPTMYDEESLDAARIAYSRYVLPNQPKAKVAKLDAKFETLITLTAL